VIDTSTWCTGPTKTGVTSANARSSWVAAFMAMILKKCFDIYGKSLMSGLDSVNKMESHWPSRSTR
jgi:hypothetical protein